MGDAAGAHVACLCARVATRVSTLFQRKSRRPCCRACCLPGWSLPPLLPQVPVAEFLAEGDHATRMLKHWGDLLDHRLPPPALLAPGPPAGDAPQHAQQQQPGSHSQAAAAAHPHMAPADVRACITALRCILLLTRLTGRFIGRFLPQVGAPRVV